jgi:hypothetical protein
MELNQVTLLPEDFDTFDVESCEFAFQYVEPNDCPIARALKRELPDVETSVNPFFITINNECFIHDKLDFESIKEYAKAVKKNGSFVLKGF